MYYIDNGIGKGFMQNTSYKCEYYWNDIENSLYRKVVNINSYSDAAYSRTPVVETFINPKEIKINFIKNKYNKTILKYNSFPDKIYITYEKYINANYLKNKKIKIESKRKYRSNKKNKPLKNYKILNEQTLNNHPDNYESDDNNNDNNDNNEDYYHYDYVYDDDNYDDEYWCYNYMIYDDDY
jgi:hypothetical protein